MKVKKSRKNYFAAGIFIILILIGVFIYTNNQSRVSGTLITNEKFNQLSTNGNVACFGPNVIYSMSDSDRLQGSCCDTMSLHRYEEQVEGLKKYAYIDKIPSDPYDISVSLAKELLDYENSITLSPKEQQIYNDAMEMSDEGGPCCCMCWRWYVYEGLAEYLITEYDFNAEQITEIWNLSDGCGGEGHAAGVHA